MAFAFNIGGDDIDWEDENTDKRNAHQIVPTSELEGSTLPIRNYFIGNDLSEDSSINAFVSAKNSQDSAPSCSKSHT